MKLGKHYSFSFYPVSILGTGLDGVKLTAIIDYQTALKFDNVELLQRQIYPYLPPNTLSNHNDYTYYLFQLKDGTKKVFAENWIITESIIELTTSYRTIKLSNISDYEFNILRDQLRILGISYEVL